MIEAEASRIAMLNAALPLAGILILEAKGLFKPETANLNAFLLDGHTARFLSRERKWGVWFRRPQAAYPRVLGARKPTLFGPAKEKRAMYEYFHVKVAANASILGRFSLDPEYRNIIDRAAEEGWRYVGFLPVSQTAYGAILEYDLIFEQEKK